MSFYPDIHKKRHMFTNKSLRVLYNIQPYIPLINLCVCACYVIERTELIYYSRGRLINDTTDASFTETFFLGTGSTLT